MPNWCTNEVDITADLDNPQEFWNFLVKAGLSTDKDRAAAEESEEHNLFHKLVPMPEKLRNTTATIEPEGEFAEAMKGNREYDYTDWYTWSLANWGTKWDVNLAHVDLIENTLSLSFDTAWSPANGVWEKVSEEFPSLDIRIRFLEEGMGFIGETKYKGGEEIQDTCLDISTEMYVAAGCTTNDEGKVDWDEDQDYNLFKLFEQGLDKWEKTNA